MGKFRAIIMLLVARHWQVNISVRPIKIQAIKGSNANMSQFQGLTLQSGTTVYDEPVLLQDLEF